MNLDSIHENQMTMKKDMNSSHFFQEGVSQESLSPSITQLFIETRTKKNLKIEEIAHVLRINPVYIKALETNDLDHLPERVYTLGFVKSYAKILDLESELCVQRFKNEVLQEKKPLELSFPTHVSSESVPGRNILIYSSLAFIMVCFIGFKMWQEDVPSSSISDTLNLSKEPEPTSVAASLTPSPLASLDPAHQATFKDVSSGDNEKKEFSNSESLSSDILSPSEPLPTSLPTIPHPPISSLQLIFSQPSWVEIKNISGTVMVQRTFQPNETYTIASSAGCILRTGNAGGIKIKREDSPPLLLGKEGQVLTNVSLDADALSAYLNQN